MVTKEQLLVLKTDIDRAKARLSELNGKKTVLLEQLQKQWNCKNVEQADKKLAEYQKQIDRMTKEIEQSVTQLEEKYEFN